MPQARKKKEPTNIIPFIPDGDFYFTKGVEAFQNRKFDLAIKWMKKAIDAKPKEPLFQCQMSVIYTEIGAYHAANQVLTEVLQNSNYIDCYYLIANNYAHLGLLNDARKYAMSYLEKEPEGDFSEDAKSLLEVIEYDDDEDNEFTLDDEDDLLIYQETAFFHMENQEWEEAIPVLEELMSLFPDYMMAKHDYCQALFFSGNQEKAIEQQLQLLEVEPLSLYSHANLAIFYYETGDLDAYQAHIGVLENIYPMHEQQKLRLAVTFARTGNYQAAYQRFLKLGKGSVKNHPSFFRWYSISAYQVGEPSKALELWQEGCKRHPLLGQESGPWNKE
ncbi:hypothetical protein D8M04_05315 [Oceanobacillus piezotolerans]|uniref:Tetratricopeptide repeat protein n=1 Tax=Oceanobacillus piezotolerans TaxID=2448030 RepID=A0A498D7X4_9BACI|nr:hypothetical protein [Oceanobacillus piezotolerans]RLL46626.1 hypothetical protein D8M04_05315 [Oceanobacillus piezotolerans]